MCRVLGCVAAEPVSLRHELVEAENPFIRQSEIHDSGWGMAVYRQPDGSLPHLLRFPRPAFEDSAFQAATELKGRIFNVHVRRATMGGLTLENTHPFSIGEFSFSHNGTVIDFPRLLARGVRNPSGQTDSEHFFNYLMRDMDPTDIPGSLRHAVAALIEREIRFSGINCLLSDGRLLYAYRLGMFDLCWLARDDRLLVSSEPLSGEDWVQVEDDRLLTLDPGSPGEPRIEPLLGPSKAARARITPYTAGADLHGAARGEFAAASAADITGGVR
jgi:glutamine amidotransferase